MFHVSLTIISRLLETLNWKVEVSIKHAPKQLEWAFKPILAVEIGRTKESKCLILENDSEPR
jgi:hypothetical protein